MYLELLEPTFLVCQLDNFQEIPWEGEFCFVSKTDQEISLVCPKENCPTTTLRCEDSWRCLRIPEVLDFGLVGILAKISGLLAQAGISIFAISTYNTDYILCKENQLPQALTCLIAGGYEIK